MVEINETKCIGCTQCVNDCIAQCITLQNSVAHIEKPCFQCGHCVAICPTNAIRITDYDMEDVEEYHNEQIIEPCDLLHMIKCRRSIRNYLPKSIELEKLHMLIQAGRYTATAKNTQKTSFLIVQQDLETLKDLLWSDIEDMVRSHQLPVGMEAFSEFLKRRNTNRNDDYLFRNAPCVVYILTDHLIDGGLAAQNIELMAVSQGLGVLYNGYLARITQQSARVKEYLQIEDSTIATCMLVGYSAVHYKRSAPHKPANYQIR